MSQELMLDGDHEEMVTNWIAESEPCDGCTGDGEECPTCDGVGRVLIGSQALRDESERQGDLIALFRAEY